MQGVFAPPNTSDRRKTAEKGRIVRCRSLENDPSLALPNPSTQLIVNSKKVCRVCARDLSLPNPAPNRWGFIISWAFQVLSTGRNPSQTGFSFSFVQPYKPTVSCGRGRAWIDPPSRYRNPFHELCDDRRRVIAEKSPVSSDTFDEIRPDQHRRSHLGQADRPSGKFLGQPERRIGYDPIVRFGSDCIVVEKIHHCAEAIGMDIASSHRTEILCKRLGHEASAASRLPTRALTKFVAVEHVLQQSSGSPLRCRKIVETV